MELQVRHSRQAVWDAVAWDAFVTAHPAAHPLQLSAWGALKSEFGWTAQQIGLWEGKTLRAGAQILFRRLPVLGFLPLRIAYIPKGPVVDWQNPALIAACFRALHQFCRRHGVIVLKIEPELADSPAHDRLLRRQGFRPSVQTVQPRTTVWLDLNADEETLLARMKQKWRYNVRLAAKKGVTIRRGTSADLAAFTDLMAATGDRDDFAVHSPAYYRRFWELFAPAGQADLLLAEYEGRILAGLMVAATGGRAYYLYGASSNEERNLMPNHLLQWEAMRWARAQGCTRYDLWGVPNEVGLDPEAVPPDPPTGLWGVWRFKQGFGGEVVRYVGAWNRLYLPPLL